RQRGRRHAVEVDTAGKRNERRDRPQQRALAGAVRADHRQPAALLQPERDAVEDGDAVERHRQALDRKRAHCTTLLLVRRTTAKNGAPKNAVTTPIGSSAGAITVRASTSVKT